MFPNGVSKKVFQKGLWRPTRQKELQKVASKVFPEKIFPKGCPKTVSKKVFFTRGAGTPRQAERVIKVFPKGRNVFYCQSRCTQVKGEFLIITDHSKMDIPLCNILKNSFFAIWTLFVTPPPPGYLASTSPLFTIYSPTSSDSTMGNTTNSAIYSTSSADSPRVKAVNTAWDADTYNSLPSYESSVKSPIYVV